MRKCVLLALTTVFVIAAPLFLLRALARPGGEKDSSKEKEAKMLDGRWEMVNVESEGNELGGGFRGFMAVIKGETFDVVSEDGQRVSSGTIKLDPDKKPPSIDLTYTAGASKGMTRLGVYWLQGDTLRVAFADAGAARPHAVESKPGSKVTLYDYRRKKD